MAGYPFVVDVENGVLDLLDDVNDGFCGYTAG
jgi:hypothetical protein